MNDIQVKEAVLMPLFGLSRHSDVALFYTGYLLYIGVPAFLNIDREEGLSFSSSTLAIGVLVLEVLLALTVILWGYGYRLF